MRIRQAVNPFLPGYEYTPDGEPHVFGDRVYLYGSHDKFNGVSFCRGDYVCWSASVDDLTAWDYEGVVYRRRQDPEARRAVPARTAADVRNGFSLQVLPQIMPGDFKPEVKTLQPLPCRLRVFVVIFPHDVPHRRAF